MTTVAIKEKYVEALTAFGDLEEAVDRALQRYSIEQITTKVSELQAKEKKYQERYGMSFETFAKRTSEDEAFINQLEGQGYKTWEIDLADWEFCTFIWKTKPVCP
ncbi:MAG TPA: hypothetical protein VF177_19645 [Anaerolineae bacterium]